MKKVGLILGIVIVIIAVFIFARNSYYPPLPIENLSAKEVIGKLEESDSKLVEIEIEDDTIWYITRTENKGILIADQNIKQIFG